MQSFKTKLQHHFPFEPTASQAALMDILPDFFALKTVRKLFVLTGYAGTGKTTFTNTLIKALADDKIKTMLLAPTGRAAKVLAGYTQKNAQTIHRKIYQLKTDSGGKSYSILKENKHSNTLFIIDEASLIGGAEIESETLFGRQSVLDDLIQYVYQGKNCIIMFIGDMAQLPPVKLQLSPALDIANISFNYNMEVMSHELRDVVRQQKDSGILLNATALRILINKGLHLPVLKAVGFDDVFTLTGNEIGDVIAEKFNNKNPDDSVIICRSNKQANRYNQYLRNRVFDQFDELSAGDRLMILKNNYYWLDADSEVGFIANGDTIEIKAVLNIEDAFGFRFADIRMALVDYPEAPYMEVKILLNTLYSETPALSYNDSKKLWDTLLKNHEKIKSNRARIEAVKSNAYYNALQVKFAYAITCHKSQGGQWPNVFVDQGFMTDESYTTEHLRWLYTAVSRASSQLYYINFEDRFFKK
ncbi:MAG: AAA family ATPase [Bacteroidia bacterium]|nr:AAA family ATPase [Bacteroidia bacterium]